MNKQQFRIPTFSQVEQQQNQQKSSLNLNSPSKDAQVGNVPVNPPPAPNPLPSSSSTSSASTSVNAAPNPNFISNHQNQTFSNQNNTFSIQNKTFNNQKRSQSTIAPASRKTPMQISARQKQNPIVQHLRALPYEFTSELHADFLIRGPSQDDCCVYFLSLQYHRLNPDYLWSRLGTQTTVINPAGETSTATANASNMMSKIILIQTDIDDPQPAIRDLTKISIQCQCTLFIGGRDAEECARVLERFYALRSQPNAALTQQVSGSSSDKSLTSGNTGNVNVPPTHLAQVIEVLTTIKGVSRRDAVVLLAAFGSWRKLMHATEEELALCNGIGAKKAKRLWQVFNQPFLLPNN